jgi:5'-deoxynucleotidase YfbR-like HD superfamily hydrolase
VRGCLDSVKKRLNFTFDECRRFSFGPRKSLRLDFPGGIHGEHAFFGEPGKQHSDRGYVLLDRGRRGPALKDFDICGDRDRFDVFEVLIPGSFTPGKKLLTAFINDRVVDYDFTQLINGYVRALVMDEPATTRNVLRSLRDLVAVLAKRQERLPTSESFIAYLLGRFPFNLVDPSPRDVLARLEALVRPGLQAESATTRRFARTGARTIAISQMRLGKADKGEAFLRDLLLDPDLAAIDRGYHRLYYRDCIGYRDKVPDCYIDSPSESWRRTFQHLAARIRQALPELADPSAATVANGTATLGQETQHKIVALLLFVQSRLGVNSNHEIEHRAFAKQVVTKARHHAGWPDDVLAFLEMMNEDLQEGDAGIWRFIIDLYRLKLELRRGWLHRGMDGGAERNRVESVAEHSFMAALLASILLPEQIAALVNYRRQDVVSLLLAHDVAEAFTGDIVTYGLAQQERNAAWELEERAHRQMRWKSTYGDAPGTPRLADLCIQFARGRSLGVADGSVIVAREMDKLENLFQAYIYRASRPDQLTEEQLQKFVCDLRKDVTVLDKIYDSFVAWANQRRDTLLSTRRPLYDLALFEQTASRKAGS